MARFSEDDLSKLDSTKPRILISIGIQEEKNAGDLQEDCSKRKNYYKENQNWQLQQPFYVEEPSWVDVDIDHIDSSQRVANDDPYILTRGKKIYRIKDSEQVGKAIEDYEASLSYPSKIKKLLIKSRVRRSITMNEDSQDKTDDIENNQIKERNHDDSLQDMNGDINTAVTEIENGGEKSSKIDKISEESQKPEDTNSDVFTKKYEKDELKYLTKRSLRGLKFTKHRQIFMNGIITDATEQKRKDIPNDIKTGSSKTAKIGQVESFNKTHFANNINKSNEMSVLLKNQDLPGNRKKRDIDETDAKSKKDIEKNETYKQIKTKTYINELNKQDTPDNPFILFRDPLHNEIESLNKKDTAHSKAERAWKLHYAHRKKLEDRLEINKNNAEITNSQLNSESSETKTSNEREKRDVCKACKITVKSQRQQDEWLRDIERKFQESMALERRDKHRDILEHLTEPYFISRGKKAPQDLGKEILASNSQDTSDEDRAKMMNLSIIESLLRTLLMERIKCDNDNCVNPNRLLERLSPRDRRGSLDEIFAAYDPYYVARGKRMIRSQKGISFETDTRQ